MVPKWCQAPLCRLEQRLARIQRQVRRSEWISSAKRCLAPLVPGQYGLSVDFAGSQVQVPFRIMTKDERKNFRMNSEDLKKGYEAFLEQESEKAKQQG